MPTHHTIARPKNSSLLLHKVIAYPTRYNVNFTLDNYGRFLHTFAA